MPISPDSPLIAFGHEGAAFVKISHAFRTLQNAPEQMTILCREGFLDFKHSFLEICEEDALAIY